MKLSALTVAEISILSAKDHQPTGRNRRSPPSRSHSKTCGRSNAKGHTADIWRPSSSEKACQVFLINGRSHDGTIFTRDFPITEAKSLLLYSWRNGVNEP